MFTATLSRLTTRRNALSLAAAGFLVLTVLVGASAAAPPSSKGGGTRDKTPPTLAISGLQASSTVLNISGTASDNVGVAAVKVSIDGGAYATAQGTTSWTYVAGTTKLSVGTHSATVRASDAAGNVVTISASFTVPPPPVADTTPPSATIADPTSNASVSGSVTVEGTATDNAQVAAVDISIDGGTYRPAQGTSTWTAAVDTSSLANGSHTLKARATDTAGNAGVASETINVDNDVSAPSISITAPSAGATVSGPITVTGTASDDVSVARVEVSIDGGAYTPAQGTSTWSYSLDTSTLANASHTITARATDGTGKTTTGSVTVTVSNALPTGYKEQLVTPEGATILIGSDVTNWTAQQVYDLLKPNAYELSLIGPSLTVKVQNQYASQTTSGASSVGNPPRYSNFSATIYLKASNSSFSVIPDSVITHEYGCAWTQYHLWISRAGDWNPYLTERGLLGNPLLDSNLNWSRNELIADDYRLLFGTQKAQDESSYINPYIADPRTVAGLKDWFLNTWATP